MDSISRVSKLSITSTCLFFFAALIYPVLSQSSHIVSTRSGRISGEVKKINGVDIVHFLGIPYAEPPLGKLRFAKTVPVRPWNGIRSATKLSATCWQYLPTTMDLGNPASAMWLNNTEMSEDCLYLNVWAPLKILRGRSPNTAMLIWIYGGGFIAGSANIEIYNGAYMAAKDEIVVASMQYRLGPFGFFHLQTDPSLPGSQKIENAGLWDQNMAMDWLFSNAEAFGAEKHRITLMGESAGAVSVSMHLLSPYSQRLFSRAILHSGSFLAFWSLQSSELAHRRSVNLAWAAGCVPSSSRKKYLTPSWKYTEELLECLRGLDSKTLIDKMDSSTDGELKRREETIQRFFGWSKQTVNDAFQLLASISFVPVKETAGFFPLSPEEAYKRKTLKKASLLLGTNQDEGTYYLFYYLPQFTYYLKDGLSKKFSDVKLDELVKKDLSELIVKYILPLNYLYPEVLDEVLLMYSVPSKRLFPVKYQRRNMTQWIDTLDDITGDLHFKCCVLTLGSWYSMMNQPVYVYSFEHRTKANTFPAWTGTMHGYELDYSFGMPLSQQFRSKFYSFTQGERQLSESMMTYWSNFVKTGNPNKKSVHSYNSGSSAAKAWPVFNVTSQTIMRFQASQSKANVLVGTNSRIQHCKLWMNVVPNLSAKLHKLSSCDGTKVSGATVIQSSLPAILIPCFTVWWTLNFYWWTSDGLKKRPCT